MPLAATDAAFEGFRLVRRAPKVLVAWTLVYLLITVAQMVAMVMNRAEIAEGLRTIEAFGNRGPQSVQDFQLVLEANAQMTRYSFWVMPLSIVVSSVLSAGVARGVLFPEQSRFGFLRLGMDEVRVFLVTLGIGLLTAIALGVAAIIVSIFITLSMAVTPLMWLGVLLSVLASVALFVWLMVKWSLAVPITVSEKKVDIFASFRATKGHFWPLLGMAIIAFAMAMVIWFLSSVLVAPLSLMSGLSPMGLGGTSSAVIEQMSLANPGLLLLALSQAIVYALFVGVMYAPFAAAWRDIKRG
ncbi:hypothetical protein [Brevundimonas sp.]|uniref:hypothetical protein n=1 Tax=Brevundimonas sp. TaxID=1871086 RepID=UPI003F6FC0BC